MPPHDPFVLSLFIYHKFRICTIFFVSAYKQEVHICNNTKTSGSPKLTRKLVSEIGGIVVQKLDTSSVRERIFKIYKAARKHI